VLGSDYPMVQGILLFFGVITVFLSFIDDLKGLNNKGGLVK
jgi:ABC-type dipeptide/oligopeptide/nickel transport system permease component